MLQIFLTLPMASYIQLILLYTILLISISNAQTSFRPSQLVLPIQRHTPTRLYVAMLNKRIPPVPLQFVIDLNGRYLWANCQNNYLSSTHRVPLCQSTQCSFAGSDTCVGCSQPKQPGCNNNSLKCGLSITNPVTRVSTLGQLTEDRLLIQSSTGSNPGRVVSVPRFLFGCTPNETLHVLEGPIPPGTQGFVGLGRTQVALQAQLAAHFGLPQKFALCLGSQGVMFFGNGPYNLLPNVDASKSLSYTPLTIQRGSDYTIYVTSIKINNKTVPINATWEFLKGVKINTLVPYTILESSIFKDVTQFYAKEFSSVPRVAPVKPFGLCFNASLVSYSRMGPGVPYIDFVMQKSSVPWTVYGVNAVVRAGNDALCLAFVDRGRRTAEQASIVIGTHQMEDNLLQFDLANSRLGFSSSLLFKRTTCSNFNFTSTPQK